MLLFSASVFAQKPHPAKAAGSTGGTELPVQLPVQRVVLYKNGVGYFEHSGRVTGNQAISLDFTSSQLDDVLQSLTAVDLGGGRIAGVNFNSTVPLEQQLKNLPLGLGKQPSTQSLFASLSGASVEISGGGQGAIRGRILHYEIRSEKTASGGTANHRVLTMVTDDGAIRSLEITPAVSVRLLDGGVRGDLERYLAVLATAQNPQQRQLRLQAEGTGTREIHIGYISEVPVWKSTYRIVFPGGAAPADGKEETATLQGWAVVDNTTGSDWNNVRLSLVAGAPQSFIEPLSQPIYTQRPVVAVPEAQNIAPMTHEDALNDNAEVTAAAPARGTGGGFGGGIYHGSGNATASGVMRGVLGGIGMAHQSVEDSAETIEIQDEAGSASAAGFDDYFEYTLSQPVTIHKDESALVPFLQADVQAERVTIWNASHPVALRAIRLTNSSKLTLDRGSFSIFENGEFAGEGLTDPIHAGEKRLLSYAADQAVHVSTESNLSSTHLRHLTVQNGVLIERNEAIREVTYVVHNTATDTRDVLVEHPVEDGWKITSEVQPAETTASVYRFNVITQPGETVRLHVGVAHILNQRYMLTSIQDPQLNVILNGSSNRDALEKALAPVLSAREQLQAINTAIDAQQTNIDRITDDEKRLHDELSGLNESPEGRELAKRYIGEINADEDQLTTLKKARADLEQQRTAAQQTLDDAIRNLNLDEDVS
ncbi:MAG TPA: hypothetical protein VHX11_09635 [Acidobacteriaceae bacterium]|nr:hypothetical protein [Acidobacteriaceae bacterium]